MSNNSKKPKRTVIDKATANLIKWSGRPHWADAMDLVFEDHLLPVCAVLETNVEDLIEELRDLGMYSSVFGAVFEDLASTDTDDGLNLVGDYLKHRRWHESTAGARYLQKIRTSVMSLYEVVEVVPGNSCRLKDLLRGGPAVVVYEKSGTQQLVKWDVLAARVLIGSEHEKTTFTGAILPLRKAEVSVLLDEVRHITKGVLPHTSEQWDLLVSPDDINRSVKDCCPLFTHWWITSNLERIREPLPALTNSAGETFVTTETVFRLNNVVAEDLIGGLDACKAFDRADNPDDPSSRPFWNWLETTEESSRKSSRKPQCDEGLMLQTFLEGGKTVKGSLELLADRLVFTANSRERTEEGIVLLQSLLGDALRLPLTGLQSPKQLLTHEADRNEHQPKQQEELDPQLKVEFILNYLDGYYRDLLNKPIPALNNQSPRRAAKTKKGRAMLVEWLKLLENNEHARAKRDHSPPYNTEWMWQELGVEVE